jgi:hypothetical protein
MTLFYSNRRCLQSVLRFENDDGRSDKVCPSSGQGQGVDSLHLSSLQEEARTKREGDRKGKKKKSI